MEAQIANIKSINCFSQTNSPNITLTNKLSCTVLQREQQEWEEANTKVIHCINLDVLQSFISFNLLNLFLFPPLSFSFSLSHSYLITVRMLLLIHKVKHLMWFSKKLMRLWGIEIFLGISYFSALSWKLISKVSSCHTFLLSTWVIRKRTFRAFLWKCFTAKINQYTVWVRDWGERKRREWVRGRNPIYIFIIFLFLVEVKGKETRKEKTSFTITFWEEEEELLTISLASQTLPPPIS